MYGDRIRPLTSIVVLERLWGRGKVIILFRTFARTESGPCRLHSRDNHREETARRSPSFRDLPVFRGHPCQFGPRGPKNIS